MSMRISEFISVFGCFFVCTFCEMFGNPNIATKLFMHYIPVFLRTNEYKHEANFNLPRAQKFWRQCPVPC